VKVISASYRLPYLSWSSFDAPSRIEHLYGKRIKGVLTLRRRSISSGAGALNDDFSALLYQS
jgi:hypothetical protein